MSPVGFEPAIAASERPQTHDLDRTAIGIGLLCGVQSYLAKPDYNKVLNSYVG
jgi:hypothetical protein